MTTLLQIAISIILVSCRRAAEPAYPGELDEACLWDESKSYASACEWTGNCTVPGCADVCQVQPTIGAVLLYLDDRAFSEESYQLCPNLAQMVRISKDAKLRSIAEEPLDGDSAAVAPSPQSLYGGSIFLGSQGPQYFALECPTVKDVDFVQNNLIHVGLTYKALWEAHAEGQPLSAEQSVFKQMLQEPNWFLTQLPYYLDPLKINEYMAANCTTKELGGLSPAGRFEHAHYQWYHGDLYAHDDPRSHIDKGGTFRMCVDTFGGYEEYARRDRVKNELCLPPFGEEPWCHEHGYFHWPTTIPCADALAEQHFISATYLRRVQEVIKEAHDECKAITTQEECERVARDSYEARIAQVLAEIPLKALGNKTFVPGGAADTPNSARQMTSDFATTDAGGEGLPDTGVDAEFDPVSTGIFTASELPVEHVTREDLETSGSRTKSFTLCCAVCALVSALVGGLILVHAC